MTGNCVGCHMRRGGTSDIPHVLFTDHWIRAELPEAVDDEVIERSRVRTEPFTLVDVTALESALSGRRTNGKSEAENQVYAGLAYWSLYETEHTLPAYLPEIVSRLRRGLQEGIDRPDARRALGRSLAALDSLRAAERVLVDGISLWPEDPLLAYELGSVRIRLNQADGAVEPLGNAVSLAPFFTEGRRKYAEALASAGRSEEAVTAYREAVRKDPIRHPEAWNNLGFHLLRLGRPEEAKEALRQAVALDPTLAEARANLGTVLLAEEDVAGAAAQFEEALRFRPDYIPALGNLGVIRIQERRYSDARRLFERVLQISPGDRQATAYLNQLNEN